MNQSPESKRFIFSRQIKDWWVAHDLLIYSGGALLLLGTSIYLALFGNSNRIWLFLTIPFMVLFVYFAIFPRDVRLNTHDWLVDHAFTITAVISVWIIAVLLTLWVLVTLIWAPQDILPVSITVADSPQITVNHPHTILADGKAIELLVTISNETAFIQTPTLTITKSADNPIVFIENPDAGYITKSWIISPTTLMTSVVALVNNGTETTFIRKPITFSYSTSNQNNSSTTTIAEGIWGARLRQFVTSTVEQTSPVIILIAFLVPGLSAVLQQLIKTRKVAREKIEKEEKEQREILNLQKEAAQKDIIEELIETTRRQLRQGDFQDAKSLLNQINEERSKTRQNWKKPVQLITKLLELAELKLKSKDIKEAVEVCNEWPDELIMSFLAAWNLKNNQEWRSQLIAARKLLPVSKLNPTLQDNLAFLELEMIQQEREIIYPDYTVSKWPRPPSQKGFMTQPILPFMKDFSNGRNPFAFYNAEDELYDLFTGDIKPAFWEGHPLFNRLLKIDRVTLIQSPKGNGVTTFAYGLQYYSASREVFALFIAGNPKLEEIQQRFILLIYDFVLTFPKHLRRFTGAEMDLLAYMLVSQIGKPFVLGRIQAQQAALSKQGFRDNDSSVSERTQLQLLANKLKHASYKEEDVPDWLSGGGISRVLYALGFQRTLLVLESNNVELAQVIMNDLLSEALRWQLIGLYTVFFFPENTLIEMPSGEFYHWHLNWNFQQLKKLIDWRYRSFVGARRTILEIFDDPNTFDFMLRQCVQDDKNQSYSPRRFIELWHNITKDLTEKEQITKVHIERKIPDDKKVIGTTASAIEQDDWVMVQALEEQRSPYINRKMPDRKTFSDILEKNFNLSELEKTCFNFNIDYENFPKTKAEFIVSMITYFERTERLMELWITIQEQRPFLYKFEQA